MAHPAFSLEGKTIIVTGGGIGIGKSISLECARAGADIMLCSRRMEHLEATADEIRALGQRASGRSLPADNVPTVPVPRYRGRRVRPVVRPLESRCTKRGRTAAR